MTISRRSVLTGIGAAAIAPALPSVAAPVSMAGLVDYVPSEPYKAICWVEYNGTMFAVYEDQPQTVLVSRA